MSARDVIAGVFGSHFAAGSTADAILSALSAAGYAVVPREPTEAMIVAGEQEPLMSDAYRAMLAAGEATDDGR